ncbi:MAG TPA: dockerin type I domain-containing protein, partial [Tepidisphaeraceae bacterium]
ASSTASSNWGRQYAWSTDGQFTYHLDSSATTTSGVGGLWKINAATGQAVRLSAALASSTEPAVLNMGGGIDRIVTRGGTANNGGLDYVNHNTTTGVTSAPQILLTAAALADFLDRPGGLTPTVTTAALTSDASGNLYFNDSNSNTSGTRVVLKLDPQGRLIKITSGAERQAFYDGVSPNSNTNRMQTRTIQHPTAGSITQLMFADTTTDSVQGANVFTPGDFNRDGAVTAADRSSFLSALTPRGTRLVPAAATVAQTQAILNASARYDLNGNGSVDWKDVKILQPFLNFADGDVNLDGQLNLIDLTVLSENYYTLGGAADKTWGDGDIASANPFSTTYAATAADANLVNLVDVQNLAYAWLYTLNQPTLTEAQLSSFNGQFRSDVEYAFATVPEPTTAALLAPIVAAALARRRRR